METDREGNAIMANLEYYSLLDAFYSFRNKALRFGFYVDEIYRMEHSLTEMDPTHGEFKYRTGTENEEEVTVD